MSSGNDSILALIKQLCNLHEEFSRDFLGETEGINLKKRTVKSYFLPDQNVIDSSFLKYAFDYCELMSKLMITYDFEYDYQHWDFRFRTKQKDSIVNKLQYYRFGKSEEGGSSLNKCLNDLLGCRIILDTFDHDNNELNELCQTIQVEYKIKCMNSTKEGYKATHIYFYGQNTYFPWELQIWQQADAHNNEKSHKEHKSKREYISWPKIYKLPETEQRNGGG